ncbi:MAG: DUF1045 domain-containing protein [Acidocella sp.]|nr:DUF1045 domain-containing protein [Acidocella sp.]
MAEPARIALYYAPETEDPLWALGSAWLGRDAETGAALPQPANISAQTTDPRRYGFHATLRAPMALRHGLDAFLADAAALAASLAPFPLPDLAVTRLGDYLALCLATPSPEMAALERACVIGLDRHRVPEDAATQAKRAQGRPPHQLENLARWGYPMVLEDFLFHMTLSNALPNNPLAPLAEAHFGTSLRAPRVVKSLAIFVEPEPGAPFRLTRRFGLGCAAPAHPASGV